MLDLQAVCARYGILVTSTFEGHVAAFDRVGTLPSAAAPTPTAAVCALLKSTFQLLTWHRPASEADGLQSIWCSSRLVAAYPKDWGTTEYDAVVKLLHRPVMVDHIAGTITDIARVSSAAGVLAHA